MPAWNVAVVRARNAVKRLLRPYFRLTASRSEGLADELRFWDRWLSTRGGERYRPEEFASLLDPDEPLAPAYRSLVDALAQDEVRILDVGAGPLTMIGKKHPTKRVQIVAADILAKEYNVLLERHRLTPPVRTVFADGQNLMETFPENSFDLVIARNSIDHADDPVGVILQMLLCVKEDHTVVMDHVENEADHQNCQGLHQWNLSVEDHQFIIRGRGRTINVSSELASLGEFECTRVHDGAFRAIVHVRKRPGASVPR